MPNPSGPFRVGTRGSLLAMAQANAVSAMLEPLVGEVEIVKIRTSGDAGNRDRVGAFVSEIEQAVRDGQVDLGLHCLKDIPTRETDGLSFAAYLKREDPRDALLTCGAEFKDLPSGAVIGTGSLRRTSQLSTHRRDFTYKPLVGNVDTRMGKLKAAEYDGIVLAVAGLKRLGLLEDWRTDIKLEILDVLTMVPAAGQATLVLQMRSDDPRAESVHQLNDRDTEIASLAERAFLTTFGGGCSVPVAGYAERVEEHFTLHGLVSSPDGLISYRGSKSFGSEQADFFGRELAEELGSKGGFEIVKQVVEQQAR